MLYIQEVLLEDISICDPEIPSFNEVEPGPRSVTASPVSLEGTARLVPVLVRSGFGSEKERTLICRASHSEAAGGLEDKESRVRNWRKVCLPETRDLVAGWASLEHPDFQEDLAFVHGTVIYAMAIFCGENLANPHALGHLFRKGKVYTALFVRSVVGGEKYERVGVGKLFGDDFEHAFRVCEKRKVVLV
jgi:hypothetical protein